MPSDINVHVPVWPPSVCVLVMLAIPDGSGCRPSTYTLTVLIVMTHQTREVHNVGGTARFGDFGRELLPLW